LIPHETAEGTFSKVTFNNVPFLAPIGLIPKTPIM